MARPPMDTTGVPFGYAPTQDHPAKIASPHATWYQVEATPVLRTHGESSFEPARPLVFVLKKPLRELACVRPSSCAKGVT